MHTMNSVEIYMASYVHVHYIFYCTRSYIKYLATVVHCFSAVTLIMPIVFRLQIFHNHYQPTCMIMMIVIFCKISNMCSRIKSISMQTFLFFYLLLAFHTAPSAYKMYMNFFPTAKMKLKRNHDIVTSDALSTF